MPKTIVVTVRAKDISDKLKDVSHVFRKCAKCKEECFVLQTTVNAVKQATGKEEFIVLCLKCKTPDELMRDHREGKGKVEPLTQEQIEELANNTDLLKELAYHGKVNLNKLAG